MAFKLAKTSQILQVCAKLHNFVIEQQLCEESNDSDNDDMEEDNEDTCDELTIIACRGTPMGMRYLPTLPDEDFTIEEGTSLTRIAIVDNIKEMKHQHPIRNQL